MPVALHRRPTHAALAAGSTFGLVVAMLAVAFLMVVQQAVRQGEARRRTTALLAEATWRCKALRERGASESCLARLHEMPEGDPGLKQLVAALATPGRASRP